MNVFIDCGAYFGDTIGQFFNWKGLMGKPEDYEIHAFEPNPDCCPRLKELAVRYGVRVHTEAVWVAEEEIEFAIDQSDTPLGSTAMKGKRKAWDSGRHIKVQAIDFSSWLTQFAGDYVIVKMDIEGAEFPVLQKMISDGTINIPNRLMVEFHPNKVEEYTTTDKLTLIEAVRGLGVDIREWH